MKTTLQTITVLAAAALMGAPARGQQPRTVTLDEALALFARNNLELRVARTRADEAAGSALQARAMPNPTLAGSHEPLSGNGSTYSESYFNVSQRLEWPGTRTARAAAADHTVAIAVARITADSMRIAFDVKRAYLEAAHAQTRVDLLRRVATVFVEAEARGTERLADGDISRYDLRRMQIERVRYGGALAAAEFDAAAARRYLTMLVSPDPGTAEIAPSGDSASSPPEGLEEQVISAGFERRPELRAANAELESARAAVAAARGGRIPDVTATGGLKRQSDGFTGAYLGLSLALPIWDRRGGAISAASARAAAVASRLALVRRQIENDVGRAVDAYRSFGSRAVLLENDPAGEAGDLLDIAQIAYDEGEMDLLELLDAAAALYDARSFAARLRTDHWIAYYDLERAVGGFDRSDIDAEEAR